VYGKIIMLVGLSREEILMHPMKTSDIQNPD
jgi:hypothetical protein